MSLNVELLQQSFEKIRPCADEFAASFYENLFAAHPEVEPLFAATNMEKQQRKLLKALVLVIENLRNPEVLGQVLQDLGARHVGYGAIAQHYSPVGEALLLTLEQYVQEDWTPEVKQAWVDAYNAITIQMLKGAGIEYAPEKVQLETKAIPEKQVLTAPAATVSHKIEEIPNSQPKDLPVQILQKSFEKIEPRAEEFVNSFYENLFAAHTELKPLFANTDTVNQQKDLLKNLGNPEALGEALKDLGVTQLTDDGEIRKYYPAVGKALLKTIEQYIQQDWTPELRKVWVNAFRASTAQILKDASVNYPSKQVLLERGVVPKKQTVIAPGTPTEQEIEAVASKPPEVQSERRVISEKQIATTPTAPTEEKIESVADSQPKELPVELLQRSFEKIKPRGDEFAASFYENLFAAHPEVKPLFSNTDMEKQQKKLLNALVLVVEGLRNPEALEQVLLDLGARHIGYGAISQHYGPVSKALLLTIEQYLQPDWTPEIKQAWAAALRSVITKMLKGAGVEYAPEKVPSQTKTPQNKQLATEKAAPTEEKIESVADSEPKELPVELLQRSFEKIKPKGSEFAASFYENLFAAYPEVKPLFSSTDMEKQQKKLLNALVLVVEGLRNPEALEQVLLDLGARHIGYGALSRHYGPVGKALLLTIEQYVGEDWTPEVKQAWVNAYRAITSQMLKGAGVEISSKVVRQEKAATLEKPKELKAEQLKASNQIQPQIEPQKKPLISFELPGKLVKGFKGKTTAIFQGIQPLLSVKNRLVNLKQLPAKSVETFWTLPTWGVAAIAAILMAGVYLIVDENSPVAKVLNGADAISLLVAVVLFIKEAPDRKKQFHYQAWSTIDAAHNVKVSYARVMAMQDLNQDGVSLRGLDTPGAELAGIILPNVNLSEANLSKTDLSNANLIKANLNNANLTQAKISGANISNANLSFARLSQANLSSANLSGANLICADLSKANMSGVNLKNASLSGANFDGTLLIGANLKDAKVSISELKGASLEGATMPDGSKYKSQKG